MGRRDLLSAWMPVLRIALEPPSGLHQALADELLPLERSSLVLERLLLVPMSNTTTRDWMPSRAPLSRHDR
jgi:hypothetical protein